MVPSHMLIKWHGAVVCSRWFELAFTDLPSAPWLEAGAAPLWIAKILVLDDLPSTPKCGPCVANVLSPEY